MAEPRPSVGSFLLGTVVGVVAGIMLTGRSEWIETCLTVLFILALVGATIA